MVKTPFLIEELARLKKELEQLRSALSEKETALSRAAVLLENSAIAIGRNDRHSLEQLAGVIGEFLEQMKAG